MHEATTLRSLAASSGEQAHHQRDLKVMPIEAGRRPVGEQSEAALPRQRPAADQHARLLAALESSVAARSRETRPPSSAASSVPDGCAVGWW